MCVAGCSGPDHGQGSGSRLHRIRSRDIVLNQDRYPVQRATDFSGLAFTVEILGDRHRVWVQFDHRTQSWPASVD